MMPGHGESERRRKVRMLSQRINRTLLCALVSLLALAGCGKKKVTVAFPAPVARPVPPVVVVCDVDDVDDPPVHDEIAKLKAKRATAIAAH